LVSIIGGVFVFWGLWSGVRAKLELQSETNKQNIETLRVEKVSKSEFLLVLDQLKEIKGGVNDLQTKLDNHIEKK
jgi:hypothetical protein